MASTLASMATVGLAVGCVCLLETAGGAVAWVSERYHPQTRLGAIVSTDDRAATIYNGAIDFCEGHCAPRVAHGDNREKGVGRQAGDDMGCLCAGWEIWQV